MKRNVLKLLALMLVCVSLFSLVACGEKSKEDTPGNQNDVSAIGGGAKPGSSLGEPTKEPGSNGEYTGEPRVINVTVTGDDGTLSPAHATAAARPAILTVHEALWDVTADGAVHMVLCESVERISDTEQILHLRKGVEFSNGNPFTADDVLFSMKLYKDLGGLAAAKVQTVDIEKTTKIDDHTIDLILLAPTNINWTVLASCWLYDAESYDEANAAMHPIGTGPLMVTDYVPGSSITLVKNENYWGEPVGYEQLNVKILAEAAQRVNALETGMVDVSTIAATDYDYVSGLKDIDVLSFYCGSYQIMNFNLSPTAAFYQNPDARRAVAHATNREAILNAVFMGHGKVMHGAVPEYMMDYEERFNDMDDIYSIGYDKELAAELAKSSGLVNKTLRLVTNGTATCIQQTEMLQSMLKEIGVESVIYNYDAATAISLLRGLDNDWDVWLSSGASPNYRVGDQLVNGVRSRDDMTQPNGFKDNEEYLALAPKSLQIEDEKELSDLLYDILGRYESEVLSYAVVDNQSFLGYSSRIDPDSITFAFGSTSPRLRDLRLK